MTNQELFEKAKEAQKYSYSPYSHFKVGACVLTKSGKIFTGCNVENSAYGPSNCAERTAIFKAVSEGEKDFCKIAIYGGEGDKFCFPCGVCRQVLAEFNKDIEVIVGNNKEIKSFKLSELLPYCFDSLN